MKLQDLLIGLFFSVCSLVVGASNISSGILEQISQPTEQSVSLAVERIQVYGQRPLSFFRKELVNSEADFFALYNELADDDGFKVKCRHNKELGTNVRTRACLPNFVNDIKFNEAQQAADLAPPGGGVLAIINNRSAAQAKAAILKKQQEYLENLNQIASANPQLQEKLDKWNAAKMSYAFQHYKKWGKKSGFAHAFENKEIEAK